jgi:uracil-DNA glycosylase family 4
MTIDPRYSKQTMLDAPGNKPVSSSLPAVSSLAQFNARIIECRQCPRLVQWREEVALVKRAAYRNDEYWGRPVPSLGSSAPRILIVGLAPAAHGANRTGRMFTGDRSGDWLFGSLDRVGLTLDVVRITAAVHCAPPANKPTADERRTCAQWLDVEWQLCAHEVRVVVALGAVAWSAVQRLIGSLPGFGHGVRAEVGDHTVLASYHPSQQNTFTGRLTESMLDDVLGAARDAATLKAGPS